MTTPRLLLGAIGPALTIAAAVGAWALVKSIFGIADFVLPSPKAVVDTFLADPRPFLVATRETAISAAIGFEWLRLVQECF